MRGRAPTRGEARAALALWLGTFLVLLAVERPVGFARDESVYFDAGASYAAWFRDLGRAPGAALSDAGIRARWEVNHEHPALMKTAFGLSHAVLHEGLGVVRSATAFRVPALAVGALVPALLFLLGAATLGRGPALFAALSFYLVPRLLFDAVLAAFDLPVAAAWLLVVYAFWRALEDLRWGVWCGVAFGLALATKHNALVLPLVLTPFALWRAWAETRGAPSARAAALRLVGWGAGAFALLGFLFLLQGDPGFERAWRPLSPQTLLCLALPAGGVPLLLALRREAPAAAAALAPLLAMAVLGPVLFYLHWPYLWHAPVERTAWYLRFHATHNHYAWFYLGELLRAPPFPLAYVLVKTALTVPASLVVPMATGAGVLAVRALGALVPAARRPGWLVPAGATELLLGANAAASITLISLPDVPHFGGTKHWDPSMPFLALLAGGAVWRGVVALQALLSERGRPVRPAALAAPVFGLLLAPALVATACVWPYGTSAYGELAGGLPGAASLGMQRQFWSTNVTGVLPWINAHAPRGARVWLHEVNGLSFRDYQRNGMLRQDLRPAWGPGDADLAAYQYHQEFREQEFELWQAFGTRTPVTGLYLDETPQVVVYQRP